MQTFTINQQGRLFTVKLLDWEKRIAKIEHKSGEYIYISGSMFDELELSLNQ